MLLCSGMVLCCRDVVLSASPAARPVAIEVRDEQVDY